MVMQVVADVSWVGVMLDTQLIEVSVNQAMIGPDNGLAPNRWRAIIWTKHGILLTEPLRTNLREILMKIQKFSSKNAFEMLTVKWWPLHVSQTQLLWVWMTIYVYQKPGHKVSHICLYAAKVPSYFIVHIVLIDDHSVHCCGETCGWSDQQMITEYGRIEYSLRPSDAYMPSVNYPSSVHIMACRMTGAKPLSEPMLEYS